MGKERILYPCEFQFIFFSLLALYLDRSGSPIQLILKLPIFRGTGKSVTVTFYVTPSVTFLILS